VTELRDPVPSASQPPRGCPAVDDSQFLVCTGQRCVQAPVPSNVPWEIRWLDKVADPNEWQFWVVPTALLDARHPTQKTAGERTLDRLVDPIGWHGLKVAVDACRQ